MRLKTKLVLAITALVFLVAGVLSLVYVSQLLDTAVKQTYNANEMVAEEVRLALQRALVSGLKDQQVDPNNPGELRNLAATAVRDNAALQTVINAVNRYSMTVYDINIADNQSSILLSTNPENEDKPLPVRPSYEGLIKGSSIKLLRTVFGPPRVFDVVVPLDRNGEAFLSVHVGVRTTLLRAVYEPQLKEAVSLMGMSLIAALVVAFLLGNLALSPLEQISQQLDYWTHSDDSEPVEDEETRPHQDTAVQVSNKIERIGQRMRNVEEVFSALKENLEQMLGNLQDGILLFTADGRAVLVSEAARRFLALGEEPVLGRPAAVIFSPKTLLGRTLKEAFAAHRSLSPVEIRTESGVRIQASVEFIHDDRSSQGLGALVTLHDLESVERIGSELELSRRMAAIGRLTSGVGHEVKNPINAIVVHLELLKTKLGETSAPAMRHLEVIDAEIRRLDRVVQTLVDFSRPVELDLREHDLRAVIGDVFLLASDEFSSRQVELISHVPDSPLMVNVDADLLKQALINVILNGAQAMQQGGRLEVRLEEDRKSATIRIADEGTGVPEEIREKIFDLYFTTRSEGSGIGLSMTYRILQLHHGSIEVQSNKEKERGAEFVLRIPLAATEGGRRHGKVTEIPPEKGLAE